jgi:hypothetical protein
MSKRFTEHNAKKLAEHLRSEGVEVRLGPPSTSLHNGCSDPACCGQHPGFVRVKGENIPMLEVNCELSGSQLNKMARKLGLVE